MACGALLLLLEVVSAELALELLDATRSIDKRLLARELRVRAGPDLDVQFRDGRAAFHHHLAVVEDLALAECRVDALFHAEPSFLGVFKPPASDRGGDPSPENR